MFIFKLCVRFMLSIIWGWVGLKCGDLGFCKVCFVCRFKNGFFILNFLLFILRLIKIVDFWLFEISFVNLICGWMLWIVGFVSNIWWMWLLFFNLFVKGVFFFCVK